MFLAACIAYLTAAVLLVIARRLHWSSLRIIALVNACVDAVAIGFILYAAGGVESGLAILLVLPVLALTILADHRDGLLIAAVAALAVLVQQVFVGVTDAAPTSEYVTAGLFGIVLFIVALLTWPVANRLRESEALVRRQELDLANMAQLSQYIVQHLRESILVIDAEDRIRLINESAAQALGDENAYPDALIGEASPRLLYLLEAWRQREADAGPSPASEHTFIAADGARVIRPHFAPLGNSKPPPVLIFLEDTTLLDEKVQQSKLAALGRLSASIAHEIRNPVGAMSHAGQLLGGVAQSHRGRTASDGDHPQQRRARQRYHRQRATPLAPRTGAAGAPVAGRRGWKNFTRSSAKRCNGHVRGSLTANSNAEVEARVDPNQLRQIVWNLCENAIKHAVGDDETLGSRAALRPHERHCTPLSGGCRSWSWRCGRTRGAYL